MKINFDRVLKQLDNSDIMAEPPTNDSPGVPLTLARLCSVALINDETGDGSAKDRRYRMAVRLFNGGEQEFTVEDVAWLKEIVGRVVGSTIHAGQARSMLDSE